MYKVISDINQQSEEWFRLKWGKVGGTTLSKIMTKIDKPVNECAEFYEILSQHIEEFELDDDSYISNDMQRGNDLEPVACEEFGNAFKFELREVGLIVSSDLNLSVCSPDRLIIKNNKIIGVLESKCPARKIHCNYINNNFELSESYLFQIINYFVVIDDIEFVYIISYRPENKITSLYYELITLNSIFTFNKKQYKVSELVSIAKKRLIELDNSVKSYIYNLTNNF